MTQSSSDAALNHLRNLTDLAEIFGVTFDELAEQVFKSLDVFDSLLRRLEKAA